MQSRPFFPRDEVSKPHIQCNTPLGLTPLQNYFHMPAVLFGSNGSWLLIGFLIVQTFNYYRRGARDRPIFKFFVYLMVFITIGESAIEGFVVYHYLVGGWGDAVVYDPFLLFRAYDVMANLQTALLAPPALFVQFFFTWRIWTFCMAICGRKLKLLVAIVCLLIALTSLCAFGLAFTFTGIYLSPHSFPVTLSAAVLTAFTVFTSFADVTITVCMMVILYHAKSNTLFEETRDKLSRLFRLTIQTGLLTVVIAIPVGPLIQRGNTIYPLLLFLLGKSYMISLLANLNARNTDQTEPKRVDGKAEAGGRLSTLVFNTPVSRSQQARSGANVVMSSSRSGVLSFIRSAGRSIHHDPTHPMTEIISVPDPEPQLEFAREGSSNSTHEKDTSIESPVTAH